MPVSDPAQLQADMEGLETELQGMGHEWAVAAEKQLRADREIARLCAPKRFELKSANPTGSTGKLTVDDLNALLTQWLWEEHEQLMVDQLNAEALCLAFDTKYRVASKALSSKQSRLRADTQIHGNGR